MNSLNKESVQNSHSETIILKNLDYCLNKYSWKRHDFIKIDAQR